MTRTHRYEAEVVWTGDRGEGTVRYDAYGRDHRLTAPGKPDIPGSSDSAFRGDASRWNPEELLVAAVAGCHQLWWLHLCAVNGVVVRSYRDKAWGEMLDEGAAGGRFLSVTLRPEAEISAGDEAVALALHDQAHGKCFIAASLNFPVTVEPVVRKV
jgi:organic hydroperoxide reductase OsmC/OhrA